MIREFFCGVSVNNLGGDGRAYLGARRHSYNLDGNSTVIEGLLFVLPSQDDGKLSASSEKGF